MTESKKLRIEDVAGEAFHEHFALVLNLPSNKIDELADFLNTDDGIVVSDTDQLLEIWKPIGRPIEELQNVLSVLKHIYDEAIRKEISPDAVIEELESYCEKRDITAAFEERKEAIKKFISPSPGVIKRAKVEPFATGVVPVLYSISGVVNLRAAFSDRTSEELVGFVPVAEVRLVTYNDHDKDTEIPFSFQVTEAGISKLIKNLESYKKQLLRVKSETEGKLKLYELDPSSEPGNE